MCAQTTLVEERHKSRQADFHGPVSSVNGDGVRLLSGEENVSSELRTGVGMALTGAFVDGISDQQTLPIVLEGAFVVSAGASEFKFPTIARIERTPDGGGTVNFHDYAETLLLSPDSDTLYVNTYYTEKPLPDALASARFFEVLSMTPGVLSFEAHGVVGEAELAPPRIEVADLPLSVPDAWIEDHRNRIRLLEGLFDIWRNTGVEIRYPENTDDEEGLRNYNFVQGAVRGGWVALTVSSLDLHVPEAHARSLLEELQTSSQVSRAFYLEVPNESYLVFGKEVDLGPSDRYLAAARLATTREEIEEQLSATGNSVGAVSLTWEPIDGAPVHVLFDQWPTGSSPNAIRQELREYEAIYGVRSQHFKQAWERREPWTLEVQDASRWFSLIEADEELAEES